MVRNILKKDSVPSIKAQTNWRTEFFEFGKAQTTDVRIFNPSIIHWKGTDWLIGRKAQSLPNNRFGMNSLLAFVLDSDHRPTHFVPIHLSTANYKAQHFEDPRITVVGNQPWLSYCTFQIVNHDRYTGAHQQVAVLADDFQPVTRWDPIYKGNGGSLLLNTDNEKNWVWFEHDGMLCMIYNTEPHQVVHWIGDQVHVEFEQDMPEWEWGHKRGGTPPIRIGDEYLCFFHSSTKWTETRRRYHMGAYTFEAKPPFKPLRCTTKPLLSGSREDPWADGLPLVVFPCGSIYRDNKWLVTMGVNDFCSAWMEIPHSELEARMEKI